MKVNITQPTLVLDEAKCKKNIRKMATVAKKNGVSLRPHFKTHQSLEIGRWFKQEGVNKITVSSISMAAYFSSEWDDITVAFPVNIKEIDTINTLAQKITLGLLIENNEAVEFLAHNLTGTVKVFLKIDLGYHRTGIDPNKITLIDDILSQIDASPKLDFQGFIGHAGHSYKCRSQEGIWEVHRTSMEIMAKIQGHYQKRYPSLITSIGDTPTCSVADQFPGIDEIRPGNFVFYDLSQVQIGSAGIEDIAVAMACPVVAVHQNRNELVVYGGGVHFSKEFVEDNAGRVYGRVVESLGDAGWGNVIEGMYIKNLSQEHGIVHVPEPHAGRYKLGDILWVLPVHSCMTANLMKSYCTTQGKRISAMNGALELS